MHPVRQAGRRVARQTIERLRLPREDIQSATQRAARMAIYQVCTGPGCASAVCSQVRDPPAPAFGAAGRGPASGLDHRLARPPRSRHLQYWASTTPLRLAICQATGWLSGVLPIIRQTPGAGTCGQPADLKALSWCH